MHSFLHVWRLIFIRLNPQLPGELIMPVIKLTQESISPLLCSEDKRCEQFCIAACEDFCSKFAEPIPAVPHGMSGTRTMQQDKILSPGLPPGHIVGGGPGVRAKKLKAELTLGADPQAERNAKRAVPTFEEVFLERYMPEAKVHNRGWRKKLQMYELRLKSAFGHKRINEIKRAEVRSWHVSLREDGLSPAYSDRFLSLLRHVLNFCVQSELLDKNPAAGVKPFNPDNRVEHYLNQDELTRLLTALSTWKNRTVALILLLAAATGMRIGEILKLKWAEVDLEHKMLTVSASTSKSKKIRSVPLNETAMEVLSKLDTRGEYESVFINKKTRNTVHDHK